MVTLLVPLLLLPLLPLDPLLLVVVVGVVVVVVAVVVGVELVELLLPVAVAAVVVVAALVVATLAVVRLRESAGSFPLINVIAITSHTATNSATAPLTTRERISRFRCALVMAVRIGRHRRTSVWGG